MDYIKGFGKLSGPESVEVALNAGGSQTVEAKHIILAVGYFHCHFLLLSSMSYHLFFCPSVLWSQVRGEPPSQLRGGQRREEDRGLHRRAGAGGRAQAPGGGGRRGHRPGDGVRLAQVRATLHHLHHLTRRLLPPPAKLP